MKTMNQYLISFLLLFAFVHKVLSEWTEVNWMGYVNGNLKLNQINIPGTHDSGTYHIETKELIDKFQTQEKNITEQLESGVRYLDIRLGYVIDDDIKIMHSDAYCELTFKTLISNCREFLDKHKTESIIIHIKNENNCKQQQDGQDTDCSKQRIDIVNSAIKELISNSKMYDSENADNKTRIPTLDEVRGKIVMVTRIADYSGIVVSLPDNPKQIEYVAPKCNFNDMYECRIQDAYELALDDKWKAIEKIISDQKNITQGDVAGENILVLNFMSTTEGNLKEVATEINKRLVTEESNLAKLEPGKQYGWILADFITADVGRYIYQSNTKIDNNNNNNDSENNNNNNSKNNNSKNNNKIIKNNHEAIEKKYAINSEKSVYTEEQVKHLYNGQKAHDNCIKNIKDVIWYRSGKNSIKEHLSLKTIEKFCNRKSCRTAYTPGGNCYSKNRHWAICKRNIIKDLKAWIPGQWKVKNINYC